VTRVLVSLSNETIVKTFIFPDDSEIHFKSAATGYIKITPRGGLSSWFNPDYVVAIMPGLEVVGR